MNDDLNFFEELVNASHLQQDLKGIKSTKIRPK